MRLLTLNIRNGGGRKIPCILSGLLDHNADILVLTEFRNNTVSGDFRKNLSAAGFVFQAASHDEHRVNNILIASRLPFEIEPHEYLRLDPVRLFNVRFDRFSCVGLHMPNLKAKIPHWNALLRLASSAPDDWWIFMGDFNTGRNPQDSEGYKFSCADYMKTLEDMGWIDAWRHLHPDAREYSWYSHKGRGFRLDHAFLSPPFKPLLRNADYDHVLREKGITDHSALIVDLAL